MNPHSLTYSLLPSHLLEPLLQGVISLPEAAELWDSMLMVPLDQQYSDPLPQRLHPACERLRLWATEVTSRPQ